MNIMDEHPKAFRVGQLYSSIEIQEALSVGNAGGVRVAVNSNGFVKRVVVMTSAPSARQAKENPYHDRLEGDCLVYTGSGLEGEQSLAGANKRFPQQVADGFPIYGFMIVGSRRDPKLGPRRWKFLGLLEYIRHFPDTQVDARGNIRKVWLFEFRIHNEPEIVAVQHDFDCSRLALATSRLENRDGEDEASIEETSRNPESNAGEFDPIELESIRRKLLSKAPEAFENFVKDLMVATGYENVCVTRFTQDGGVDINANVSPKVWALSGLRVQVQAKRWLHTVGRKEVAELRGSLEQHARGAVVTTSHFSKAAILEAGANGKSPIALIDGYALAKVTKISGIGV
ncbi:MAG: restriction endonuclease [Candidatus Hydrogenedentes bacterium]|nr:restriction endonuclease [Candidatus Hydrogenedentota bacterium]